MENSKIRYYYLAIAVDYTVWMCGEKKTGACYVFRLVVIRQFSVLCACHGFTFFSSLARWTETNNMAFRWGKKERSCLFKSCPL